MHARSFVRAALSTAFLLSVPALGVAAPAMRGCPVFPADNIWNVPVDGLPVDPRSDQYLAGIGVAETLHPDFGSGTAGGSTIGVPYVVVEPDQPLVPIVFTDRDGEQATPDEADTGPYPVPSDAPVEGGLKADGDRHVLLIQRRSCTLSELFKAAPKADGSWEAVQAARFDLRSNALRPDKWTSADGAGLPIFPGLVRYEEVAAGEIAHALRFTAPRTRKAYVWPARHYASDAEDPGLPPMGQRFRLKASFDISGFSPSNQVILKALQTYGMMLADNGSSWFVTGEPSEAWNNDDLHALGQLKGADFEAVDVSSLMVDPNSGQARAR